jgi:hypothetical protein
LKRIKWKLTWDALGIHIISTEGSTFEVKQQWQAEKGRMHLCCWKHRPTLMECLMQALLKVIAV